VGVATEGGENESQKFRTTIDRTMTGMGFHEIYTYSFVSPSELDQIRIPAESPLRDQLTILNPLGEDTSVMRTHPLPSILRVVSHNQAHRVKSAAFYENATLYFKEGNMSHEEKTLCFAFYGDGDFYDLKGNVDALMNVLQIKNYTYASNKDTPYFHPGRCADLYKGDVKLGTIGQVHPAVCANFDIDTPVFAALLSNPAMESSVEEEKKYVPLPVYQAMERDLALLCDDEIEAGTLCDLIRSYAGKSLVDTFVFDVYKGKGIADGKKSVAVRLVFRMNDRTMTDEEADSGVRKVLKKLESGHGITLRG
jgi:phenylalanyl-tRNA synthetase beta chain